MTSFLFLSEKATFFNVVFSFAQKQHKNNTFCHSARGVFLFILNKNEVIFVSVRDYIIKDNQLSRLHYLTVYQTIMTLINKGILKVSDLK